MTHICVGKLTIIGSDKGFSPGRHQAIFWTNAGTLWVGHLGTNFSPVLIEIHTFSLKKIHLKMLLGNGGHFVSVPMTKSLTKCHSTGIFYNLLFYILILFTWMCCVLFLLIIDVVFYLTCQKWRNKDVQPINQPGREGCYAACTKIHIRTHAQADSHARCFDVEYFCLLIKTITLYIHHQWYLNGAPLSTTSIRIRI